MTVAAISTNPASLSYFTLRKAVGYIAFFLSFALAIGYFVLTPVATRIWPDPVVLGSISAYYYTCVGHVFTGALCAIALFLLCTKGYDRKDEVTGYIASALALGTAFCPTTPDGTATPLQDKLGTAHFTFAAALFLVLSYFCFFLFTIKSPNPTRRKLQRNIVYRVCGSIIVFSIAMIAILKLFLKPLVDHTIVIWMFETFCLLAFGAAWLIKGQAFLKDEEPSDSGSPAVEEAEARGAAV